MEEVIKIGILLISFLIGAASFIMLLKSFYEIYKKNRKFDVEHVKKHVLSLVFLLVYIAILVMAYKMFTNFFILQDLETTNQCLNVIMISFAVFTIYYYLTEFFKKDSELRLFAIILIGLVGALAYAFIMFLINNAVQNAKTEGLYIFFILAILTYVFAQKLTRKDMISFANDKVFNFREQVFNIVLNTSHEKLQKIEVGRIFTCINNDMEILGNSMRDIVTVATNLITIIVCFMYLAILSFKSFLVATTVFILALGVEFIFVKKQEKIFEKLMNVQHKLYNLLDNLVYGHKELIINRDKRKEYKGDVTNVNRKYKDTRINVENTMTNTFVGGQILLYVVIGIVIFAFPVLFKEMDSKILGTYAMTFVFIINPISYLVDLAPRAFQAKVSYDRIKNLINELSSETDITDVSLEKENKFEKVDTIKLKDVYYSYDDSQESFQVGPINCKFEKGKINFIIGGNGSGKSTIAKTILGLYKETKGEILINGTVMTPEERGEYFSAVFSDYYLFKKIYGVDTKGKENVIDEYLDKLRIKEKVAIENNELSTIDLSSGQRKRIALLLCYLEDKSVYLFDEWAADQDAEFREFFYLELLPEMKRKGKIIIAITHDDRYFYTADKVYKMEMGKIREIEGMNDI